MEHDEKYMALALTEAAKGFGRTSPNPCVGAVIVQDGRIVATGYHQKAGEPHAERNAIAAATESLQGATMYVTLEPCNHTGKTPPCCDALIKQKFSRVVVGMRDPNPRVNGKGLNRLTHAGIEVCSGVLEQECRRLNLPFLKHISTGMPWIIMKAGLSLDGRLNYKKGKRGSITGQQSLQRVHELRNQVDAIMVGSGTVIIDNPSLTTRLQKEKGRDPVRIILDSELRVPQKSKIFHLDSSAKTLVFCSRNLPKNSQKYSSSSKVEVITVTSDNGRLSLKEVFTKLGKRDICSVLVEGGSLLHGSLIKENLYDEAYLFYAPVFAGDSGVSLLRDLCFSSKELAPSLEKPTIEYLGEDWVIHGFFTGKDLSCGSVFSHLAEIADSCSDQQS